MDAIDVLGYNELDYSTIDQTQLEAMQSDLDSWATRSI